MGKAKYQKRIDLQSKVDQYFDHCEENKKPYTITGLAYFLGFKSREALTIYEHKPEFDGIITRARLRVEANLEERLLTSKNVAGIIFNLINNFKWVQRNETVNEVRMPVINIMKNGKGSTNGTSKRSNGIHN